MKSLLLVFMLLVSCDCNESQNTPPIGTIVTHKLTGEKGIVVAEYFGAIDVRMNDYEVKRFNVLEFEVAQPMAESKPSTSVNESSYHTGERKWNPETKTYR